MSRGSLEPDQRIVWGTHCAWWDSINRAGLHTRSNMPCCPYCGGGLMQMDTWKEWMDASIQAQENGNPGYVGAIIDQRGKCDNVEAVMKGDPGIYYIHRMMVHRRREWKASVTKIRR